MYILLSQTSLIYCTNFSKSKFTVSVLKLGLVDWKFGVSIGTIWCTNPRELSMGYIPPFFRDKKGVPWFRTWGIKGTWGGVPNKEWTRTTTQRVGEVSSGVRIRFSTRFQSFLFI